MLNPLIPNPTALPKRAEDDGINNSRAAKGGTHSTEQATDTPEGLGGLRTARLGGLKSNLVRIEGMADYHGCRAGYAPRQQVLKGRGDRFLRHIFSAVLWCHAAAGTAIYC